MSGINKWGPPTWLFLHMFADRINENFYSKNKNECLNIIKNICSALPCIFCRTHAINFMKKVNEQNVPNKAKLIEMLFTFHNQVNTRLRKPTKKTKFLKEYKKYNFGNIIISFRSVFKTRYGFLMNGYVSNEINRKRVINDTNNWLKKNWNFFN
jgi:hypothetical protein